MLSLPPRCVERSGGYCNLANWPGTKTDDLATHAMSKSKQFTGYHYYPQSAETSVEISTIAAGPTTILLATQAGKDDSDLWLGQIVDEDIIGTHRQRSSRSLYQSDHWAALSAETSKIVGIGPTDTR